MKTLAQEVKDLTDDKVNAARLQLKTLTNRLDGELSGFELHTHMACLAILQTLCQHRQQVMQMEAAEMQRQHALKQQEQQAKAQAQAFERAKEQQAANA